MALTVRKQLAAAACAIVAMMAAPAARATITQVALADLYSTFAVDSVNDRNGPIVDAVGVELFDPFGSLRVAIGPAGDLGMAAEQRATGYVRTGVSIRNEFLPNLTNGARLAQANFIIDGGELAFVAGASSTLTFVLSLAAEVFDGADNRLGAESWFTEIELAAPDASGASVATFRGVDIGAARSPRLPFVFEIPTSLQTFGIGLVPSGGHVRLSYQAEISSQVNGFAEVVRWQFSDPLSVDGASQFPTVAFIGDGTADVPAPATLPLLAAGLLLLGLRRYALTSSPSGEAA